MAIRRSGRTCRQPKRFADEQANETATQRNAVSKRKTNRNAAKKAEGGSGELFLPILTTSERREATTKADAERQRKRRSAKAKNAVVQAAPTRREERDLGDEDGPLSSWAVQLQFETEQILRHFNSFKTKVQVTTDEHDQRLAQLEHDILRITRLPSSAKLEPQETESRLATSPQIEQQLAAIAELSQRLAQLEQDVQRRTQEQESEQVRLKEDDHKLHARLQRLTEIPRIAFIPELAHLDRRIEEIKNQLETAGVQSQESDASLRAPWEGLAQFTAETRARRIAELEQEIDHLRKQRDELQHQADEFTSHRDQMRFVVNQRDETIKQLKADVTLVTKEREDAESERNQVRCQLRTNQNQAPLASEEHARVKAQLEHLRCETERITRERDAAQAELLQSQRAVREHASTLGRLEQDVENVTRERDDAQSELKETKLEAAEHASAKAQLEHLRCETERITRERDAAQAELLQSQRAVREHASTLGRLEQDVENVTRERDDAQSELKETKLEAAEHASAKAQLEHLRCETERITRERDTAKSQLQQTQRTVEQNSTTTSQLEEDWKRVTHELDATQSDLKQAQLIAEERMERITQLQQDIENMTGELNAAQLDLQHTQCVAEELSMTKEHLKQLSHDIEGVTQQRDTAQSQLQRTRLTVGEQCTQLKTNSIEMEKLSRSVTSLENTREALEAELKHLRHQAGEVLENKERSRIAENSASEQEIASLKNQIETLKTTAIERERSMQQVYDDCCPKVEQSQAQHAEQLIQEDQKHKAYPDRVRALEWEVNFSKQVGQMWYEEIQRCPADDPALTFCKLDGQGQPIMPRREAILHAKPSCDQSTTANDMRQAGGCLKRKRICSFDIPAPRWKAVEGLNDIEAREDRCEKPVCQIEDHRKATQPLLITIDNDVPDPHEPSSAAGHQLEAPATKRTRMCDSTDSKLIVYVNSSGQLDGRDGQAHCPTTMQSPMQTVNTRHGQVGSIIRRASVEQERKKGWRKRKGPNDERPLDLMSLSNVRIADSPSSTRVYRRMTPGTRRPATLVVEMAVANDQNLWPTLTQSHAAMSNTHWTFVPPTDDFTFQRVVEVDPGSDEEL